MPKRICSRQRLFGAVIGILAGHLMQRAFKGVLSAFWAACCYSRETDWNFILIRGMIRRISCLFPRRMRKTVGTKGNQIVIDVTEDLKAVILVSQNKR